MIAGVSKSLSSFFSSCASAAEVTPSSTIALPTYHPPLVAPALLAPALLPQSLEIAPPLVPTDLIIVSCTCSGNPVAMIDTFTSPS